MKYTIKDFISWARSLASYHRPNFKNILFTESDDGKTVTIEFYTCFNKYVIRAMERGDGSTWMEGTLVTRAPYPGESHVRFNDLSDGEISPETWAFILSKVIASEMVPIQRNFIPLQDEENQQKNLDYAVTKYLF